MTTLENIKAEVQTTLKQYDDAGLIDDISLNNYIKNALKEFGGNVMIEEEVTIPVKNGMAKLPDNFYSLINAIKCDFHSYKTDCEEDTKKLQSIYFYEERIEDTAGFTNILDDKYCRDDENCRKVTTRVFWESQGKQKNAEVYYTNLQPLRLVKTRKKQKCDIGCENLNVKESPYEISVYNYNYIQTNFNEGYLYIVYRGLPYENGDLLIPETHRGKLQEYIQYTCIRRILEAIMFNNDDPAIVNKLNYARQQERETYQMALSETFVENIRGFADKIRKQNRARVTVFENSISYI